LNRKKLAVVLVVIFSTFLVSIGASVMGGRPEPYGNFRFRVEIDGIIKAGFKEVEGLNVTVDVVEYREGNELTTNPMLLPGLSHYGPLILRYGVTMNTQEMWEWMEEVLDGDLTSARRSMSLIVQDSEGNDAVRYNLSEVWPSGWSLGKLDSVGRSMAIEELVIQYEGLERESLDG